MNIQHQFNIAIERNNIKIVKNLINNIKVNPADNYNWAIREASENGFFDIVELLINNLKVNPTCDYNHSISIAYYHNYQDVVNLLWNLQAIKQTLKKDNLELYNKLITKDIKNKVSKF